MKRKALERGLLSMMVAAILVSCSSTNGTEPSAMSSVASGAPETLLATPTFSLLIPQVAVCSVQPYAQRTKIIGVSGGKIEIGKNKFEIPSHSLAGPVSIKMELMGDSARTVRFSPEGLVFNPTRLPKLELDTHGCRLPKGVKTKVAYTTESLRIITILASTTDSLNSTVDADLHHFSRYAVAW